MENMSEKMNLKISIIKVKKMKDGLFTLAILKQLKFHQNGTYGFTIPLTKFQIKMVKKNIFGKKTI